MTKDSDNFLEIIQGDTYYLRVSMSEDDIEDVESVEWTSSDIGLDVNLERHDLVNDDGTIDYGYDITLSSDTTEDFEPMRTVYCITITYNDESIETGIYNGLMRIYSKE